MVFHKAVKYAVWLLVAIFVGGSVLGMVLGQPVFLTYVETGSMSPTLEPGDGFVAIPISATGGVETGDVIVFQAKHLDGGGLVTHRVVGTTDGGYVTLGDGNPFPDQSVGEPPVSRDRVVAKALQVNGEVVVIPNLGGYATGMRNAVETGQRRLSITLGTRLVLGWEGLLLIGSLLMVAYGLVSKRMRGVGRKRERSGVRTKGGSSANAYTFLFILLVVGASTTSMLGAAHTDTYRVRTTDTETATYTVSNGVVPSTVVLVNETAGIVPENTLVRLGPMERRNVSVTISSTPGGVGTSRTLSEYRYPTVLPPSLVAYLHFLDPRLAILAVDAVLAIIYLFLGVALLGTGRIRNRSRSRDLPLTAQIKRFVRGGP